MIINVLIIITCIIKWICHFIFKNLSFYTKFALQLSCKMHYMLHIDPWPSRLSEILSTGCTCENMREQSRAWTETCGCYEMIYTVTHVKSQSWVILCLQPEEIQSVMGAPVYGCSLAQRPTEAHNRRPGDYPRPWPRSWSAKWGLEDNTTSNGQKKKLWVNISDCLRLSQSLFVSISSLQSLSVAVSHTQHIGPLSKNKETYIFL